MVTLTTEPGKVIMPSTTACQQPLPKQIASITDEPRVRDLDCDAPDRTTDAPCSMPPPKKRSAVLDINNLLCSEEPAIVTSPPDDDDDDDDDEPTEGGSPCSSSSPSSYYERDASYRLGIDSHKQSLLLPSIGHPAPSPLATGRELPSIRTLPDFGSRQNQDRVALSINADSSHKSWSQRYEPQPTIPTRPSAFQPYVAASRREHHPMHPHATGSTLAAVPHEAVPLRRSSYDASQARYSAYGASPSRATSSLCVERRRSVSPALGSHSHDRYRADAYQRHHQHHASDHHHASPSHYASSSHYASQNAYTHTYASGYAQPGTYQQQQAGSYAHYPGVSYHDPSNPNGQPMIKAKRKRANANQLKVLNQVFQQTFFPSTELRIHLGKQLGMSPRTVQIWFQNKRQSWRSRTRAAAAAVAREENKQQEQQTQENEMSCKAADDDSEDKKSIEVAADTDTEVTTVVGQHASRRSSSSSSGASASADEVKPSPPACSSPIFTPTADSSSTVSPVTPVSAQTDYFQERSSSVSSSSVSSSVKPLYAQCLPAASYDYRFTHPSGRAFQQHHVQLHHTPASSFGSF